MPRSKTPGLDRTARGGRRVCPLCWKVPAKEDATSNGYHIWCAKEVAEMLMDAQHYKTGKLWEMLYAMQQQARG